MCRNSFLENIYYSQPPHIKSFYAVPESLQHTGDLLDTVHRISEVGGNAFSRFHSSAAICPIADITTDLREAYVLF